MLLMGQVKILILSLIIIVQSVANLAWAQSIKLPPVDNLTQVERLNQYSILFINKPYLPGALGEGKTKSEDINLTKDQDPLLRYDGFDCTTFVETIMALTLTSIEMKNSTFTDHDVVKRMNRIRYKNGQVGYINRNHMTSTDWIPNNRDEGIITDITEFLFNQFPLAVAYSNTEINRGGWLRKQGFTNSDTVELSQLPYVKIDFLLQHPRLIQKIPHGTILNIVRPQWNLVEKIGTKLDVSHQGFVFHKNGRTYFRNASQTKMKVIDSDLEEYLKNALQSPSIKGVNLLWFGRR